MKLLIIYIKLIFFGFMFLLNNNINVDGHSEKKGPKLEYFGTLSYADITRMNGYKRNFIADIPAGELILANGDKGKEVAITCADFEIYKKKNN